MLYRTSQARSADQAVDNSVRWGMLIDTNAMTEADVDSCVTACQREHGWKDTGKPTDAQWIRKVNLLDPETGHKKFLPMMCQHCEDPPSGISASAVVIACWPALIRHDRSFMKISETSYRLPRVARELLSPARYACIESTAMV
jgi:hypothetical protein